MYRSMVQPVRVSRACGMASSASGGTTRTAHGPCFSDRTGTKAAALGCNSGQGCAIACSLDVLERGEDSREPFVDVMLGKVHVLSGYVMRLFLAGHLDGVFEGICHALRIVRVDEQGGVQGFGSPSELAADQQRSPPCGSTPPTPLEIFCWVDGMFSFVSYPTIVPVRW
jgi:hypothetical protein